jgi:hypothetical protein
MQEARLKTETDLRNCEIKIQPEEYSQGESMNNLNLMLAETLKENQRQQDENPLRVSGRV